MNLQLEGKNCFITGSTRGIGYKIGQLFSEEGCNVILNSRKVSSDIQLDTFDYISGDVEVESDCLNIKNEIIKKHNHIDILVCNVGSGRGSKPGCESMDEWNRLFNKNFYSVTNIVEAFKDIIAPGGSIVCISSLCGIKVTGAPIPYSVAKSALNSYVRNIAPLFAERNIRVNALALGNILHDSSVWAEKIAANKSSVVSYLEEKVPMRRLGTTDEAAGLVIFLTSMFGSFITGQVISVDGGESLT